MPSAFIPYEEMPEYGWDWAMAPVLPAVSEYRQSFSEAQAKWLEQWQPRAEH